MSRHRHRHARNPEGGPCIQTLARSDRLGDGQVGDGPIFFFDGVCNLCNGAVDWIVRHDPKAVFHFASLQGETAQRMIPEASQSLDSMVLWEAGREYKESDAVLRSGKRLGGLWGVLATVAGVFPQGFRNAVYRLVARNRYRWFGQKDSCRLPTPAERARFLP